MAAFCARTSTACTALTYPVSGLQPAAVSCSLADGLSVRNQAGPFPAWVCASAHSFMATV